MMRRSTASGVSARSRLRSPLRRWLSLSSEPDPSRYGALIRALRPNRIGSQPSAWYRPELPWPPSSLRSARRPWKRRRTSQSTSCKLFRINCRPQNASLPRSKRKTSGCLSRLETSLARSTVLSSLSRAPRLLKHPVRARYETARSDQDTTPGIAGPNRDADAVPILESPDASHCPASQRLKEPAAFFGADCEMDHTGPRPTGAFCSSPGGASRFQCPGRARPHRRHTPPAALFFSPAGLARRPQRIPQILAGW